MNYVKPTKPYLIKLQKLKDKMAYAMKSKYMGLEQHSQLSQDQSPPSIKHGLFKFARSVASKDGRRDSETSSNT